MRALKVKPEIQTEAPVTPELRLAQAHKVVRQDRYEVEDFDCRLIVGGMTFEVINYSAFGIAVYAEAALDKTVGLSDAKFMLADLEISRLSLGLVREEILGGNGIKIAFEIIGEPLDCTRIAAASAAKQVLATQETRTKETLEVPEGFRRLVYEFKDYLEQLESTVNSLKEPATIVHSFDLKTYEDTIAEVIGNHLKDSFDPLYAKIEESLLKVSDDQLKRALEFFRGQLRHLIYQSPFSNRSVEKPLGYAGDFEMMNLVYRNENLGPNLFSKCLHRYYMAHPNAQAVRNRVEYLNHHIVSGVRQSAGNAFKILSVASGPAREIQMLIEGRNVNTQSVEVHLLDQDVSALRNAQRGIKASCRNTGTDLSVKYFHKAIRNILSEGLPEKYDLIYSAGLFDYFSDAVARAAARRLFDMLKPNGKLIIGNFAASSRTRLPMDLALDWQLIYRTEKDLVHLYGDLGGNLTVEAEPEKVNLFVVVQRS